MNVVLFWIKFLFFYIVAILRPYLSSTSTSGFGKKKKFSEVEKEQARNLDEDGYSIDASYFNGFDFHGNYMGFGMQKRLKSKCESVFFIRIPDLCNETLVLPINPSTWTMNLEGDWMTDKGLKFEMIEPMKQWSVSFDGEVREMTSNKKHKLTLQLEWLSKSPVFDFDTDMDKVLMARTIASQKWSRELFVNLRELHQTHYEVFGEFKGNILLDNGSPANVQLISMKDRSFGKHRNWGDFRRYILHYIATDDGLFIGIHFVSIFQTFSNLVVGFVMDSNGHKVSVRNSKQNLSDIGEDRLAMKKPYAFHFTDTNGKSYKVVVKVVEYVKFHCGYHKDGTLFSSYITGTVNNSPATGLCEYEYNTEMYKTRLEI